jgi:hypothetical protein
MVLEEEDYSIPLMRPRKGMDVQPVFFEGICQRCKKSIDRAMIEYERKEHDEDDNNKNDTRIC